MNEVELFEDFNAKVHEHNDLITSVTKMDKTPLKIFEMVVAAVDPRNPPENNSVVLSKKKMFKIFDVSSANKYSRFKSSIEKLHQQSVFKIRDGDKKGKIVYQVISPFSATTWNSDDDKVRFKLTDEIMPYLFEMKTNYTEYALANMIKLNSKYSIILYKWISMFLNQYESYVDTKLRTKKQLADLQNPIIPVDELRRITDTEKSYERFSDLNKRVLQPSVEEISSKTDIEVTYENIKKGKSVQNVQFHLKRKFVAKDLNYKESQEDEPAAISEEKKDEIAVDAMTSRYTRMLAKVELITAQELLDKQLMYQMDQIVYPLYDELIEKIGEANLLSHMIYVKQHMIDYSFKNLPRYLATAAKDYLKTVNNKLI